MSPLNFDRAGQLRTLTADNCLTIVEDYAFSVRTSSGSTDFHGCRCWSLSATESARLREGTDDFRPWICSRPSAGSCSFSWSSLVWPTHDIIIFPLIRDPFWGSAPSASMEEIQRAFRDKSKKHHPDLGWRRVGLPYGRTRLRDLENDQRNRREASHPSTTVANGSGFETNWRNGTSDARRAVFAGDEDLDPFAAAGEASTASGPTHGSTFADQSPGQPGLPSDGGRVSNDRC